MPMNITKDFELSMIGIIVLFFIVVALLLSWFFVSAKTRSFSQTFEGVVPTLLGLPAILFSLTVALLASSVWETYNMANKSVRNEALGLATIMDLAQTIPALNDSGLSNKVRIYTQSIVDDEWKTLSARGQPAESTKRYFEELRSSTFQSINSLNSNAESKALMHAIEIVNDSRKARLSFVSFDIHPIRWYAIIVLAMLVLLTVALVHSAKPKVLFVAIGISTMTLLVPICTLALTLSSPYVGMISVSYEPLLSIIR
jgi:cation transport ATPase